MLDLELIRRHPESVSSALATKGEDAPVESILALDAKRREIIQGRDELRSRRNSVSKDLGRTGERPPDLIQEMRGLGEEVKRLEAEIRGIEKELEALLSRLPNIPSKDVPVGADESFNKVLRVHGDIKELGFEPKPHWDLNEDLGLIDFQRGVKLSGSRFYVLQGLGAKLQRALISWMLDTHIEGHGYKEIYPPALVKEEIMRGSGNLPKFRENLYQDTEDDLWLVPSAEVPLTGLHRDEILDPGLLPIYYVAYTPCFRREKASAGRDTRGIKRVHQFDKVELYKLVEPDKSEEELETLIKNAEYLLKLLELPYRVVQLCTGDLGFQSAKTYDLEVWAPGSNEWLEVSSCSNCTDFQARRSNIRFRYEKGGRAEYLHTLNGSGLAIPRIMISILETYQQADGSVVVPEVLRNYLGTDLIRPGKAR
ncbi:MAG: seryl-tRNA synthetase [Chloroflexi bacterium]|jgi:seryl-tRNA synthetase|nr:MAG: seryl-tRNA synthetase [Chloroflexota bacterium]